MYDFIHSNRCDPPCVPYIGVYLADLISIEEGVQNLNSNGLINFAKMRMVSMKLLTQTWLLLFSPV